MNGPALKEHLISQFSEGSILLFDKPYAWTSFDVVGKVRGVIRNSLGLKKLKIGHAGTLDPLATGLLILCTGKMTRSIERYQDMEKEYTGTFQLGQTTPSFDLETEPDATFETAHISIESIYEAAKSLSGQQMQLPPMFSAIKVGGKRAYELARVGRKSLLEPREVTINQFDITRIAMPEADFRIVCSKGTYIRSIARDFGTILHSGAYLKSLCRERIGDQHLKEAWHPAAFEQYIRQTVL